MNITIVTPRFAIAGVPLAQIRFARALAQRGHAVTLLVGFVEPDFKFPDIDGLNVEILGIPKVRNMLWPLVRHLRTEQPDVVFSAEDHLNLLVILAKFLAGSVAKISGSSRVTPFDTYSTVPLTKRWCLKQLARLMMSRADVLTCVSRDMVTQYQQVFGATSHVCVYNIVVDAHSAARMREPIDHPWLTEKSTPVLVAAGRLAPWKGFADLIEAIALVRSTRPVRLLILGDGPLRESLQGLIHARGLSDCVQLPGYVENPLKLFSRADVFVLSSHVEGLPNVLVEAMMCGCTPVATDCPTGPREVLDDGKYGYLVKPRDPGSIADGIMQALDRRVPRERLQEAIEPFHEETVIARHFELLGLPERRSLLGAIN
jgi:glycosyltransferase involved in cell wall biosynthesis